MYKNVKHQMSIKRDVNLDAIKFRTTINELKHLRQKEERRESIFICSIFCVGCILILAPITLFISFITLMTSGEIESAIIVYQIFIWMFSLSCVIYTFDECKGLPSTVIMIVIIILSYTIFIPMMYKLEKKDDSEDRLFCITSIMNMTIESVNSTIIDNCLHYCKKLDSVDIIKMCNHIGEIIV